LPELPEIESLRQYLKREGVVGAVFTDVKVEDKSSPNSGVGAISGIKRIAGRKVQRLRRHGKQIAAVLDNGILGLHMGMTGQIDILEPSALTPRFTRAEFSLRRDDRHIRMAVIDPRRWASIRLFPSLRQAFYGLGPDALDPNYTAEIFVDTLSRRSARIKPLLLDQSLIAGVGNIYADESLHRSRISPFRRANRISDERLNTLYHALRGCLEHALEFILSHPDDRGRPYIVDAFDERMNLQRSSGSFCPRCEYPLKTKVIGGRTAYYCPACQT